MTCHLLPAALQALTLGETRRQFVAAGAKLEGLLHLLEHLLVVAERDPRGLPLHGSSDEESDYSLMRSAPHQKQKNERASTPQLGWKGDASLFGPVFSEVLHVELVEDDLGEPGDARVQRVEPRQDGEDGVGPRSVRLWQRRRLGLHVVALRIRIKRITF